MWREKRSKVSVNADFWALVNGLVGSRGPGKSMLKDWEKVVWRTMWMVLWGQEQSVRKFVLHSDAHQRLSIAEVSLNNQVDRISVSSVLGQLTGK